MDYKWGRTNFLVFICCFILWISCPMYVGVLPTCTSTDLVPAWRSLGVELQTIMNFHVGSGTWTHVLWETADLSLQPSFLLIVIDSLFLNFVVYHWPYRDMFYSFSFNSYAVVLWYTSKFYKVKCSSLFFFFFLIDGGFYALQGNRLKLIACYLL